MLRKQPCNKMKTVWESGDPNCFVHVVVKVCSRTLKGPTRSCHSKSPRLVRRRNLSRNTGQRWNGPTSEAAPEALPRLATPVSWQIAFDTEKSVKATAERLVEPGGQGQTGCRS